MTTRARKRSWTSIADLPSADLYSCPEEFYARWFLASRDDLVAPLLRREAFATGAAFHDALIHMARTVSPAEPAPDWPPQMGPVLRKAPHLPPEAVPLRTCAGGGGAMTKADLFAGVARGYFGVILTDVPLRFPRLWGAPMPAEPLADDDPGPMPPYLDRALNPNPFAAG